MTNPWLKIPAADYEGHMNLPDVNQLAFLGTIFKTSLETYDSRSIAYLGCATGTGLEFVDTNKTINLAAIDINAEYLEILRNRYSEKIPHLKIIETDLTAFTGINNHYTLVFAGLLFEYLHPEPLLKKIAGWLKDKGVLVVVLQLKDEALNKVSKTPFSSLKQLDPIMNLINDQEFKQIAEATGLIEIEGNRIVLNSGKTFYVGAFEKRSP